MTQSTTFWQAGFNAGLAEEPVTGFPVPAGTAGAWAWHAGFIEGKAQRRKGEKNP